MTYRIRELGDSDAGAWWDIRLEALETEPFAFGKSVDEHRATSVESVAQRFRDAPGSGNFYLGAFAEGRLIGTATFARETGVKERHKGHIYGVYVAQRHRGRGVGRELICYLLDRVRRDQSLEQVLLAVGTGQEAAKGLYRSFGFEVFGTERRALKIGLAYVDEDHMALRIR